MSINTLTTHTDMWLAPIEAVLEDEAGYHYEYTGERRLLEPGEYYVSASIDTIPNVFLVFNKTIYALPLARRIA